MPTRRSLIGAAAATSASFVLAAKADNAKAIEAQVYEQGEPGGELDLVVYDPSFVSGLISPKKPFLVIPDKLPDFSASLITVATRYNMMDRWKNQDEVTTILELFGCPYKEPGGKYVAFCAAGIGYSAALAFAEAKSGQTDIASLRKFLPIVDFYNYYPSPGVLNMSEVARGKERWVDREKVDKPLKGWLVVYDWSKSSDPLKTSHTGIVLNSDHQNLYTFEFNAGNTAHPGGGTIGYQTRPRDHTIKGYIITDTVRGLI